MKKISVFFGIFLFVLGAVGISSAEDQAVKTNKDKLLTLAVQGEIAPAQPASSYAVTWDGKPKMMIGIGGINYNLKIGD